MPTHINHRTRHRIGPDRDEEPRAACAGDPWPFDEMLDHAEGSKRYVIARRLAAQVCKGCPLVAGCEFAVKRRAA